MLTEKLYPIVKEQVKYGWLLEEKMQEFEKIYSALDKDKEYFACETGVWYGCSAIAQGLIIRELGLNVKVYCVDSWSKAASTEGTQSEENRKWWGEQDHSKAYHSFIDSISHFGLDKILIPVIGKSEAVAELIPDNLCLLHIDSSHTKEVIAAELKLYTPKVISGGDVVFDDYEWREAQSTYDTYPMYGLKMIQNYSIEGQSFAVLKKI